MKIIHKTEKVYERNFWYYLLIALKYLMNISLGVGCGIFLCYECLKCTDCNNIVIIYLSIISFAGLTNLGMGIDRFVKIDTMN